MNRYEILWVPVDGESSKKSTRIVTECGTLDAIENSIVMSTEELWEMWCQCAQSQVDHETMKVNEDNFKTYLKQKGIEI